MKKGNILKLYTQKAMPPVLQILKPSGTPSHFTTKQPVEVPTLTLLEFQEINLLTFVVVT